MHYLAFVLIPDIGDVDALVKTALSRPSVSKALGLAIVASDGAHSLIKSWDGRDFVKNSDHEATVRALLAQPGRCVVVDYHS